jgi:hypothetical protein
MKRDQSTRRDLLQAAAGLSLMAVTTFAAGESPGKTFRIGVVSAGIHGKPQPRNGHAWHFAQYLHPTIDFDALQKHYPQMLAFYKFLRNPRHNFDELPFADTRITHYYDADPATAAPFTEAFRA